MKKYHYVYITTNLVNKKQYVGDRSCHTNPLKDSYLGSGTAFHSSINKYGKENFKKEILEFFDTKQEAFNAQEKWINEYKTLTPNGYNISPKGGLCTSGCHSKETIEKIRKSNLGKNKGKKHSKESKIAISKGLENRPVSKETREKLSVSLKGKNVGKVRSEEYKEKLRKYASDHKKENTFWKDKKFSEEHREKLRLASSKRWSK